MLYEVITQLIEEGQVRFIGEVIKKLFKYEELKKMTFREVIDRFEKEMDKVSISSYLGVKSGGLAFARKYEVAAAINVITSYSIHYTKLYEACLCNRDSFERVDV